MFAPRWGRMIPVRTFAAGRVSQTRAGRFAFSLLAPALPQQGLDAHAQRLGQRARVRQERHAVPRLPAADRVLAQPGAPRQLHLRPAFALAQLLEPPPEQPRVHAVTLLYGDHGPSRSIATSLDRTSDLAIVYQPP